MMRVAWAIGLGLTLGCATTSTQGRDTSGEAPDTESTAGVESSDAQTASADASGSAKNDPDELVCKYERVTGSHMSKKVCRTRRQMEEEREGARREVERARQSGEINRF